MKLRTLMIITAIVAGVFGIAFVLMPGQVFSQYGIEPNPPLNYTGQLFGAALISFAVLTWMARKASDSDTRRAIILALFIGEGIGFIVALIGQLKGVLSAMGWSTVAIYLFFTLGYGYFQFAKSAS